jgi:hypothetical protein
VLAACVVLLSSGGAATAQTYSEWLQNRLESRLVAENGKGADRQRESPAGDRSTSLVDQSSATDVVAMAFNLATVTSPAVASLTQIAGIQPSAPAGAQTVTASLYALLAGLNGRSPIDPSFYKRHVNARRATFTIGTAASDAIRDNTAKAATVLGGKILLLNDREIYRASNLAQIRNVAKVFDVASLEFTRLKDRLVNLLFRELHPEGVTREGTFIEGPFIAFNAQILSDAGFPALMQTFTPQALALVDAQLETVAAPFNALNREIAAAYDSIHQGQQLAVVYTGTLRPDAGYNDHRVELVFDYGLSPRIAWTANGSFDYVDQKSLGSAREGRFATEFVGDVTRGDEGWGRGPIRLAFSGQLTWKQGERASTDVQAKFTIPIAAGVELPVVYRYGSSPLGAADGPQARVGLSVDLARLRNGLP